MGNSDDKIFHAPERKVERARGCWSCTKFNNGEMAQQHYRTKTDQERIGLVAHMPRLDGDDDSTREVAAQAAKLMGGGMDPQAAIGAAIGMVHNDVNQVGAAVMEARKQDARFQIFNNMMMRGAIGICLVGGAEGDFVDCRYLCDKWVGRDGSSVATSGKPLDKLPEELKKERE